MKKPPLILVQVRVPKNVVEQLDKIAQRIGLNRTAFLGMMLREISEMSEAEGRVAAAKLIEKIPAIARPMVKAILESL